MDSSGKDEDLNHNQNGIELDEEDESSPPPDAESKNTFSKRKSRKCIF